MTAPNTGSKRARVLVADMIAQAGIDSLAERYDVTVKTDQTPDELVATIPGYDALIVRSASRATREVIEAGTDLKIIGRAGVGIDNVDVATATEKGVIVCNAPLSNVVSAAEQTMALMLATARKTSAADASMKAGKWERSKFTGTELYEKTLAVFGLGRIGSLVAERARAFGMNVIAYDPFTSETRATDMGVDLIQDADRVIEQADIITVHLPKTKETLALFTAERIAKMRDGVILINASRGGIFDEDLLAEGLRSGKIGGVGLDVFDPEPPVDCPLLEFDNVVLTPHLGASTHEAQDRAGTQIAEYIELGLEGRMVPTAVNVAPVPNDVLTKIRPYIDLAQDMGSMLAQLVEGGVDELDVITVGRLADYDTRIVTIAALKGLMTPTTDETVNYVNAPYFAEQRGIKVNEMKRAEVYDYQSLVILKARNARGEVRMAGSCIGRAMLEPRIISLFGYDLDVAPEPYMMFFRYPDRPGMIGKVGTLLGEEKVNIGLMQVGRLQEGGDALMILTVDSAVSPALVDKIKRDAGMTEGWFVEL